MEYEAVIMNNVPFGMVVGFFSVLAGFLLVRVFYWLYKLF